MTVFQNQNREIREQARKVWEELLSSASDFHVDKGFWVIHPEGDDHLAEAYKKLREDFPKRFKEILAALEHPDELIRTNAFHLIHERTPDTFVVLDLKKSRDHIVFPKRCSLCLGPHEYNQKWSFEKSRIPTFNTSEVCLEHLPELPLCLKHSFIPVRKNAEKSNFLLFAGGVFSGALIYFLILVNFPGLLRCFSPEQPVYLPLLFIFLTLSVLAAGGILGWSLEKKWAIRSKMKGENKNFCQPQTVQFSFISPSQGEFRFINPSYGKYFAEANRDFVQESSL